MGKEIVVVGAIIERDGAILCARRPDGGALGGMWEFPGGKIEPGETARSALEREIHEELQCHIEVGDEVVTTAYDYDFGTVRLTTFRCTLVDGTPQLTEHADIRWVSPALLPELEWAPADIPAVEIVSSGCQRTYDQIVTVPIARSFDLATLTGAIAAEGNNVDLDSAVLKAGAQTVVVETDDLIVRFPRDDALSVAWEANLLRLVHGRTQVETPKVLWLGTETRCMAYRKINGIPFDRAAYASASAPTRDEFTLHLAQTLVEIQDALAAAVEVGADLPVDTFTKYYAPLREVLSDFPSVARPAITDLLDEYDDRFLRNQTSVSVAMHNDFHFGNMLLDGPLGHVTGVWDFSCAAIGVAAWDLRYLEGGLASPWEEPVHAPSEHHDLLHRVARWYGELRGVTVDVRSCVVANRVEALFDLGIDRSVDALAAWAAWDAETAD